jgi:anti-sigma-K factor RskA
MSQSERETVGCDAADELAGAYALGALDQDGRAAVEGHLATCPHAHEELRSLIGAGAVLAASLDPVAPSPGLRDRVVASVAVAPQDRAEPRLAPQAAPPQTPVAGPFAWLNGGFARGLAVAVVVAVAFGGWNLSLQAQLSSRDRALRAVAQAIAGGDATFRVTGTAGAGYVVADQTGAASLVVADLAPLDANRIYELWLIGADNVPVAVGTYGGSADPISVVHLERSLAGFATFAVTIEASRVVAPTSQPVMVAKLPG